jgi:hypothetical protein
MLLSACGFTVMNLLLKQAMADFGVWDIGFYRFFDGGHPGGTGAVREKTFRRLECGGSCIKKGQSPFRPCP